MAENMAGKEVPNHNEMLEMEGVLSGSLVRVLAWNCRGAASPEFRTAMKNILNMYKPDALFYAKRGSKA